MQKLTEHLIGQLGQEAGKQWLKELPAVVSKLAEYWHVSQIEPMANMSWNYVAKTVDDKGRKRVLKIGWDNKTMAAEAKALQHFAGHGMVKLLDYRKHECAMLLDQVVPGDSLKPMYPDQIDNVMQIYAKTIGHLMTSPQKDKPSFRHVRVWLEALDKANPNNFLSGMLEQAIDVKNQLLKSATTDYVLHGDLHQDNIIRDGQRWIAIDPKGIVGEVAFEAAWFDFIHPSEDLRSDIKVIFQARINQLAELLQIDPTRLKHWVFVRLVLAACWAREDGIDADRFVRLAGVVRSV